MQSTIVIQNLKCGGCAATITKELEKLEGISQVAVDEEEATVQFHNDGENIDHVVKRLDELGYPASDKENTFFKKAKSYVSCAVGRMSS